MGIVFATVSATIFSIWVLLMVPQSLQCPPDGSGQLDLGCSKGQHEFQPNSKFNRESLLKCGWPKHATNRRGWIRMHYVFYIVVPRPRARAAICTSIGSMNRRRSEGETWAFALLQWTFYLIEKTRKALWWLGIASLSGEMAAERWAFLLARAIDWF